MNFKTNYPLYTSGDIKREAKAQLQGNWGRAVILCLLPGLITVAIGYNATEGNTTVNFVIDLLSGLFATGVMYAFIDLIRHPNYRIDPIRDLIQAFRREYILNLLLLKLRMFFFIFLWSLLFVIPGIVKAYSYSQAELIYKDIVDSTGDQPSARECMAESEQMMKGRKADLFALDLSFIGWYFLSVFTLGILYLWVNPYTRMSRVVFYENIVGDVYNSTVDTEAIFREPEDSYEEIGKDPDDFRDFDDF